MGEKNQTLPILHPLVTFDWDVENCSELPFTAKGANVAPGQHAVFLPPWYLYVPLCSGNLAGGDTLGQMHCFDTMRPRANGSQPEKQPCCSRATYPHSGPTLPGTKPSGTM